MVSGLIIWRIWFGVITSILVCSVQARYIYDQLLNGKSTFTDENALDRFLMNMDRLNLIQSKIFGIDHTPFADGLVDVSIGENGTELVEHPERIPYLFEGDIVLTDEQMIAIVAEVRDQLKMKEEGDEMSGRRAVRTVFSDLRYRWKSFPIHYVFSVLSNFDRDVIEASIKHWEESTCVTFKETTNYSQQHSLIEFIKGFGCYSNIGRYPYGVQQISIGFGCETVGIVAHEIGHALGFFHEQSRYDRDDYVRILGRNIESGFASQFSKHSSKYIETYGVPYDFGSAMHYDQRAFSKSNLNTIETIDPNYQNTIGQRSRLSFSDVKKINAAYCSDVCAEKLACQFGGYTDPKNCSRCRCTDGLAAPFCADPTRTSRDCGQLKRQATARFQELSASGSGECNYLITAPSRRAQILIEFVGTVRFPRQIPCRFQFVEIRYEHDLSTTGARFCSSRSTTRDVLSKSNNVLLLYRGSKTTHFTIRYKYVSNEPIKPTTTTSPTRFTTDATQPTQTVGIPSTTTSTTTTSTTSAPRSTSEGASTSKTTQNTPKTTQNTPKTTQNTLKTTQNTPKTSRNTPKTTQNTPKTTQNIPKTSQNTPKTSQNTPKTSQNTPKTTRVTPKTIQTTSKPTQTTPETTQTTSKPTQTTPETTRIIVEITQTSTEITQSTSKTSPGTLATTRGITESGSSRSDVESSSTHPVTSTSTSSPTASVRVKPANSTTSVTTTTTTTTLPSPSTTGIPTIIITTITTITTGGMSGTNATKHSASSDRSDYENVTTSGGFTTTSSTENDASFLTSTRESTANVANSTLKATSSSGSSKLASFKLMKPNKARLLSEILAFQNDDDDNDETS